MPVSNPIRRALETPLGPIAANMTPPIPIQWMNTVIDTKSIDEYVRFGYHAPARDPMTMGPQPRIQQSGYVMLTGFARGGQGADRLDQIIGQQGNVVDNSHAFGLLAAYPYAASLSRDGISVQIGIAKPMSDAYLAEEWWTQAFEVNFTCWRS